MDSIDIKVIFFGALKAHYGAEIAMSVPKGLKLRSLRMLLKEKSPEASYILESCQIAVDSQLRQDTYSLDQPHEIAVLPPFSGG